MKLKFEPSGLATPYILFQTDFGVWGGASMYGMCKIVNPALQSSELSHTVPTFDVVEASRRLALTLPFWPEGTVFVSVVDPGVGTPRRACVAHTTNGYYIVTPDNGTLADTRRLYGIREIREIDESVNRYPHTPKVSIFHGRDLFAYCAARLASGAIDYAGVGPAYPLANMVDVPENAPENPPENTPENAPENTPENAPVILRQHLPQHLHETPPMAVQRAMFTKVAETLTVAYAQHNPSAVVIINNFNHDGGLAVLRGISKRYRFDLPVYDMPVSTAEIGGAKQIAAEIRPYWPKETLFFAAGRSATAGHPFVAAL